MLSGTTDIDESLEQRDPSVASPSTSPSNLGKSENKNTISHKNNAQICSESFGQQEMDTNSVEEDPVFILEQISKYRAESNDIHDQIKMLDNQEGELQKQLVDVQKKRLEYQATINFKSMLFKKCIKILETPISQLAIQLHNEQNTERRIIENSVGTMTIDIDKMEDDIDKTTLKKRQRRGSNDNNSSGSSPSNERPLRGTKRPSSETLVQTTKKRPSASSLSRKQPHVAGRQKSTSSSPLASTLPYTTEQIRAALQQGCIPFNMIKDTSKVVHIPYEAWKSKKELIPSYIYLLALFSEGQDGIDGGIATFCRKQNIAKKGFQYIQDKIVDVCTRGYQMNDLTEEEQKEVQASLLFIKQTLIKQFEMWKSAKGHFGWTLRGVERWRTWKWPDDTRDYFRKHGWENEVQEYAAQ